MLSNVNLVFTSDNRKSDFQYVGIWKKRGKVNGEILFTLIFYHRNLAKKKKRRTNNEEANLKRSFCVFFSFLNW